MTTTQNGSTAGSNRPVKNTFKQGRHFTPIRHNAGAIIAPGANHAKENAVATLAEKRVFSRPEFMGLGLGVSIPQGRQHGVFHVITPSPIRLSNQQASGCKSQNGANQMATANTTTSGKSAQKIHDHIALTQHATERLAMALFELRNGKSTTSLQRATGLVYSAGRALSQVCGGAV